MFGYKNKKKIQIENAVNILLVDFLKIEKKFEFRNYCLTRTNLLIPRRLRKSCAPKKKNTFSMELKNLRKKFFCEDKIRSWFKKKKKEKFSSINVIEIGPRFTLKELEMVKIVKL